ncbi:MAG TPA: cell division protein FtsQ/DivIB [Mariprofundaceae bacterium]|nr:cell division protein FtsQ/DivIB [Mariprofundaceae bacterium]
MSRTNTRRVAQAELQQRRQSIRRRIAVTLASALAITATVSTLLLLNQTFRITAWEIKASGDHAARLEQQLDAAMKRLPAYDFWSTRPGMVRSHLLASVADLDEVSVQRTLSGFLYLDATARTPVGLWHQEGGDLFLVDIRGNAYRPVTATETTDLPILRLGRDDICQASLLLRSMQSLQPRYFSRISELLADSNSWKINFDQGQQWMISRNEHISHAINKISKLLQKARWRSGHWRVDARTTSRWFVRPAGQEGVI